MNLPHSCCLLALLKTPVSVLLALNAPVCTLATPVCQFTCNTTKTNEQFCDFRILFLFLIKGLYYSNIVTIWVNKALYTLQCHEIISCPLKL